MNKYYVIRFGQAYGESSYGDCVYNNTESCQSSGGGTGTGSGTGSNNGGTGTGSGGQLTDTGFMILVIATAACLILFAAVVVRIWRRPARQEVQQEAQAPVFQDRQDQDRL
jgi:cbb3-type cytochrome oxidase subunit 3